MKTQTIVILVAVAGLAAGGYYLYRQSQQAGAVTSPNALDPNNRANGSAASPKPAGGKIATTVETVGAVVSGVQDIQDKLANLYGGF
jgi:hypothetical protein